MTSNTGNEHDDFDLDDLKAAMTSATPAPDASRRAADIALARENFAALQGSRAPARHTPERPKRGVLQGVKDMLNSLTTKGGLTVTTAIVACGFLVLTPQGQDLLRPLAPGYRAEAPEPSPQPMPPQDLRSQSNEQVVADDLAIAPSSAAVAAPEEAVADMAPAPMQEAETFGRAEIATPPMILAEPGFGATAAEPSPMPMARPQPGLIQPNATGRIINTPDVAVMPEMDTEAFATAEANPVRITTQEPVSTFSIDVDTASYAIVRQSLNRGELPPRDAVRVEEMINYFPYAYPAPAPGEGPFRPSVSVIDTPWNADTRLVHIGLQGELPAITDRPPLNLVFLIDTSGSMNDPTKLPLLKQSFRLMLDELRPEDEVAIVEYAGSAGQVLDATPASNRSAILSAIQSLGAGGATNGQGGLEQAYAVAASMAGDGEVNRILLATDGDFNVGLSGIDALTDYIADKRDSGTYLSVLGFGRGNLDDATMQTLAQNGNGIAAYIDTLNEAQKVLVDQLTGALFPIAGDVKVQVEFNPAVVAEYRLIGYETRALRREDFNNDRVDAGELGAGHSVTAIYEITPVGSPAQLSDPLRHGAPAAEVDQSDEVGFLRLRWKAPGEEDSQLLETPILPDAPLTGVATEAGSEAGFAIAMAGFGQLLRDESYLGDWGWDEAIALATANRGEDPFGYRNEAVQLMRLAQSLSQN